MFLGFVSLSAKTLSEASEPTTIQEPTIQESIAQESTFLESTAQESAVQESTIQQPTIQESNIYESTIERSTIETSTIEPLIVGIPAVKASTEAPYSICTPSPCLNNATCHLSYQDPSLPICVCQLGYTGHFCETGLFH